MKDNNNNDQRPRVIWRDGKCVICKPDGTQVSKAADGKRENAVEMSITAKTTRARSDESRVREIKRDAAMTQTRDRISQITPKERSKPQSAPSFAEHIRGLKYNRSVVTAVILIAVLSVAVAVMSVSFSKREQTPNEPVVQNNDTIVTVSNEPTVPSARSSDEEKGYAVCIDPGHGFDDVGTSNDELGVYEYEVVLNVGLKLRDKLEAAGIRVYMTHDTNEPPPEASEPYLFGMKKRNGLANSLSDVDLFISIHCDAYFEDPSVDGPRIYHMSDDDGGRLTAEAIASELEENDDDEIYIKAMTGMNSYQVIRESEMPAVLIETGFLSNPAEGAAMLTEEWTETMAENIAQGIISSFEQGSIGS